MCGTEVITDGIPRHASNGGLGVGDDDVVLNVESSDFLESTGARAVTGDELSNNSEGLGGINGQARAVEGVITHAVGVEITSISITKRRVSCIDTAVSAAAPGLLVDGARVTMALINTDLGKGKMVYSRSIGSRDGVGFPDI